MSEELTINIKFSNEKKLTVTLKSTDTVSVLKQKIAEQLSSTDTPLEPDQQTLIYAGRILKDNNETIENIKVKNGNTIHMVRAKKHQPKPAETTKAAETTTASTPASTTTPAPAASQPSPAAANPFAQLGQGAANPFAQLGFNSGFASAMNNQAQNPASPFGGNLPPLDPNMLNSMLENPAVLNMLSSMFQNPQMMDMLFSSSPQLAAFNTPEFRSTMNQMMSNPGNLNTNKKYIFILDIYVL
ncbi:ubiquitin-domain-containing protein [Neocallimastix californiae]|uniref:Ubiquitin-domain-containing protein n=1 Tax=Neocallimastix californiae TaxID=1754190 RepID=A0A1Y2C2K9_9FUNG|nr:ubiquitin-domain-containing protein [Neocallimastix californiae]|eukprot:ORY41127.1 ubiquitin-domain-containing protein [Neocallimastix californiae]